MPWPITRWVSSKSLPTARAKALPNERALALDRNLAGAHAEIGLAKYNIGRAEETEAHIREALRLSPRDTSAYAWKAFAGYAKLYLGSDEEAAAWLHRAIEPTEVIPSNISLSAVPWRISVSWMMRGLRFGQDLR
jgi:tetratricopeptide (TPR) repeat protein